MTDDELSDQMKFVRKVYSILALQLTITAGLIVAAQTSSDVNRFMITNSAMSITAAFLSLFTCIALVCCFGRKAPHNLILLFLFTLCESYMVAGLTAFYKDAGQGDAVILAGLSTMLVTISLTIYAFRTKTKLEVFAALGFVVYLAVFPIMIMGLFIFTRGMYIFYCVLGLFFYSLFLIIDTMLIVGGKSMNGAKCALDDYVIGAMMLYLDIIMIFIYLLRIFGSK
mmetsp:Transcript_24733/g.38508  ORF Transcript_24733/g.38508 Transcript_24733/m.38508 type:complete len:226 (-) Transcript_24733:55-732(-)